jgi:NADH-quinone oxidoreductase subunit L
MTVATAAWVCLLAPLVGALLITLAGGRLSRRGAGYLATLSTSVAFVAALTGFFAMLGEDSEERSHVTTAWTWLRAGDFEAGLSLLVDPLSMLMMLIVSGVGSLIVAYSIGYMDGEDEERRFFAYMAFFVFSMLLLVEGANLVLLLAGWGLVGLASYLLIGFHHERPSAIAAAKKAFVMNAVGDATMALAIFLLFWQTGVVDFAGVFEQVDGLSDTVVTLAALGLLGGAVAKSAQLPLQTWLPDAMEGPTPVSALIHAATMVTAGVYLLVRLHPIYEAAEFVQHFAAAIGAVTLLVAGLIALVQTDIKRVIAYSTMSQIGYMFLAAGIGAYGNAMFHLMTHAFFKALLFLAAGIVIHALAGEQDIRKMGGLRDALPRTYLYMLIGSLALAGIFPLAGFWSKDSILASALASGPYGFVLFVAGLIGAFLTGLYTFRMIFLVWRGDRSPYVREHLHDASHGEAPASMLATITVLAVLSVIGGWVQIPGLWDPLADWLAPVAEPLVEPSVLQDWVASSIAMALALGGIYLAWLFYGERSRAVPSYPTARRVLEHKLYFDELYDAVFYRPAVTIANALRRGVEEPLVEGSIDGAAASVREAGRTATLLQTGYLRSYALAVTAGLAVLAVLFVALR